MKIPTSPHSRQARRNPRSNTCISEEPDGDHEAWGKDPIAEFYASPELAIIERERTHRLNRLCEAIRACGHDLKEAQAVAVEEFNILLGRR